MNRIYKQGLTPAGLARARAPASMQVRCYSLCVKMTLSVLLSVILLTGCGGVDTQIQSPQEVAQEIVGTNGQLIPIQSDNVQAAGYDANSMIMTVQFENGYTYEYYGIPAEIWNSFVTAQPHPWSQVGYPRLVKGGYQYKKIN
jgi:KTSC domain